MLETVGLRFNCSDDLRTVHTLARLGSNAILQCCRFGHHVPKGAMSQVQQADVDGLWQTHRQRACQLVT